MAVLNSVRAVSRDGSPGLVDCTALLNLVQASAMNLASLRWLDGADVARSWNALVASSRADLYWVSSPEAVAALMSLVAFLMSLTARQNELVLLDDELVSLNDEPVSLKVSENVSEELVSLESELEEVSEDLDVLVLVASVEVFFALLLPLLQAPATNSIITAKSAAMLRLVVLKRCPPRGPRAAGLPLVMKAHMVLGGPGRLGNPVVTCPSETARSGTRRTARSR